MNELALADFRERTRRYSYLVTLGFAFFFGYLVIVGKYTLILGECRGAHNSAWVGSLVAAVSVQFLIFFGFYLVKNCVARDRQTGMGPLLAASPISNQAYIAAKLLSNTLVLGSIVGVLFLSALIMLAVGGAADDFDFAALTLPFVYSCIPTIFVTAALAVWFESVRWLGGVIGNILYIFVAELLLVLAVFNIPPELDLSGLTLYIPSMQAAAVAAFPHAKMGLSMGFVELGEGLNIGGQHIFLWHGIDWSPAMFFSRIFWIAAGGLLAWSGTLFFNRFDPARERRQTRKVKRRTRTASDTQEPKHTSLRYREIVSIPARFAFVPLLRAELRLLVSRMHWSWLLIGVALLVAQLALPAELSRKFVYPAAWLWPVGILSPLGNREFVHGTDRIVFSSGCSLPRMLVSAWSAGLFIVMLTTIGTAIRAGIAGDSALVIVWAAGCLFVPSLALLLGAISRSNKLFEIIYVLAWYVGPINHAPALDFSGGTPEAIALGIPHILLGLSVVILPFTAFIRQRQLRF